MSATNLVIYRLHHGTFAKAECTFHLGKYNHNTYIMLSTQKWTVACDGEAVVMHRINNFRCCTARFHITCAPADAAVSPAAAPPALASRLKALAAVLTGAAPL